ncbi:MAG: hypothetical protein GTO26_02030, partial [Planctomycetales bacterium]|nr:hypothetical protein [Planctomycetales bacterium]
NYGFLTDAGTFDIVTITDASLGTLTLSAFDPLGDPTQLDFGTYWIDYTTGSSITLFYNTFVFPTPEPSTMFPLGVGLPRLIGARPRR